MRRNVTPGRWIWQLPQTGRQHRYLLHCLFLGSSLQKLYQHQSTSALFYADPQLGWVLLRTLAVTLHNLPTFSAHGLAAILEVADKEQEFFYLNTCSTMYRHFRSCFVISFSSPFQPLSYLGMAGCGSASQEMCTYKAASPWSQWSSPASQWHPGCFHSYGEQYVYRYKSTAQADILNVQNFTQPYFGWKIFTPKRA